MNKPTVLIIRAHTEIGRATAIAFAKNGNNIVISGCNVEEGESLVKELKGLKIEADYLLADFLIEDDVRNLVDWTNIRFGSLDVAVNINEIEGKFGMIVDQSIENFNTIFEMNVRSTFLSMKHEMRVMRRQNAGVIINILSKFDRQTESGFGFHTASKLAIEELTKTAALEAANENVRINAVNVGKINSDIFTYKNSAQMQESAPIRLGNPEEIANTIVLLASDKTSEIT